MDGKSKPGFRRHRPSVMTPDSTTSGPNVTYSLLGLQASTNLQTWQDLGDVIADTNGLVQFDDTNAPSFTSRFYYAVPQ